MTTPSFNSVQDIPLLTTKLYIPPLRPNLVSRPRLIEQLNAGLTRKLTLVSAPAGFGKTTLLNEWVGNCERPVAWLSLDEDDDDMARFLTYFIAALQTIGEHIGEGALSALQSPQPPPIEAVLTALINEIVAIPNEFALVLDDYHLIETQPIHDAIVFLLDHLPPQMHLGLAARADPPLPLARLRAQGQLTELRADDLRFAPDEAAAFLNQVMGLSLSSEDIAALETHTEGWIAGLQLAAISMRGRQDTHSFVEAFTGTHRYILDYLTEQVLHQQSEKIQDFMLQTSILNRLTGPLCDAVTAQSEGQATLEQLESANLFIIPLDDERRWYRYHHLFSSVLRHYLERKVGAPGLLSLHQRACDWYTRNGLVEEAFGHALTAGDFDRAAYLVEQNARSMLKCGEAGTLLRWLEALPAELARSRPRLGLFCAWGLFVNLQLDEIEPRLQDAERALQKTPNAGMLGEIDLFRATLTRIRGDAPKAIELHHQALDRIPKDDLDFHGIVASDLGRAYVQSDDLVAATRSFAKAITLNQASGDIFSRLYAIWHLAEVQVSQGRLYQAAETYQQALQVAAEWAEGGKPIPPVVGMACAGLAQLYHEWNDLGAAARHALEATELGGRSGFVDSSLHGCIVLARVKQAQGDLNSAHEMLQKAERIVRRSKMSQWIAGVAAERARFWFRQLQIKKDDQVLQAMNRWEQSSALSKDWRQQGPTIFLPGHPPDFEHLTLARAFIAQDKSDKAVELLVWLLQAAKAAGRTRSIIEILILQALAWQARGDTDRAVTILEKALSLAEPESYIRLFVDKGPPMAELLRQAASRGIAPGYAGELLAAFVAEERPPLPPVPSAPLLIEPLSDRELEVLRLVATGMSNRETAEKLFVATSTVKKHLENIYGKLDVHNRTQSVARARELDLL